MTNVKEKYCNDCGAVINVNAEICPKCGVRQMAPPMSAQSDDNRWLITLLLCFFGGTIGLHSFYNRKITIGVLQILTLGGCGIWALVDLIMILTGSFKDNDGNYVTNKG